MYWSIVKTTDTHHCTCHSSFQVIVSLLLQAYIISHTCCPQFMKVLLMYHSKSNRHQLALMWSLFFEQLSLEKRGERGTIQYVRQWLLSTCGVLHLLGVIKWIGFLEFIFISHTFPSFLWQSETKQKSIYSVVRYEFIEFVGKRLVVMASHYYSNLICQERTLE